MMTKGTAIVVVISQGPSVRELPEIANLPLAEASTAVANEGFVPSKVEEYSDTVPMGYAIGYQNANPGDKMPYGSPVVLVISKGPEPSTGVQVIDGNSSSAENAGTQTTE